MDAAGSVLDRLPGHPAAPGPSGLRRRRRRRLNDGQVQNAFAVDSFPEQLHKPITDHGDFINFFNDNVMNEMVECINDGENCQ
ncbi:hypothetical protein SPURM210S_00022 [Streptomyces purpurascens]